MYTVNYPFPDLVPTFFRVFFHLLIMLGSSSCVLYYYNSLAIQTQYLIYLEGQRQIPPLAPH